MPRDANHIKVTKILKTDLSNNQVMLHQIIIQTIEILKPITSFITWVTAIRAILIKVCETFRWYAEQKRRPEKSDVVAEICKELGEIDGITRKYSFRQGRFNTISLRKDIDRISQISSELFEKVKSMTGKSLFDILKDPPQELPTLPSDEMLKELPILEFVIKEEMRNVRNIARRTLRLIRRISAQIE
jgi:hypothetical protein